MKTIDLTQNRVITERDIAAAANEGATDISIRDGVAVTPSARDSAASKGIRIVTTAGPAPTTVSASGKLTTWDALLASPEAAKIIDEIIVIGKKLWMRQYVDGNGGNISYRLTPEAVLCTPTLCSKGDLRPEDMCLVDLEGNQLAGNRARTSEILLHLEIYKEVPKAKAVVHCHPPHATAYAITGHVPPNCIIPEMEVFVGSVAVSPYETPGTKKFAETVIPFAKDHNTILLANHGIVCWADTVTHAEWYAEVLETYCMTLLIASQLGPPISRIPADKAVALLDLKQRLGLPDARLGLKECELCEQGEFPGAIALPPNQSWARPAAAPDDLEALVQAATNAVMAALKQSS
jgi:L-fuculose-phosphate aldolase